ncbi:MAG: hypothetical protein SGI84_10760 [Gemmatimonadota bacterium]|nr:hypothetical protein [Gemmatimonadota bacterium]
MTAQRFAGLVVPAMMLILVAAPAAAQDVRAEVQIRTGPVLGRILIGERRPERRERVMVVERDRRPGERIVVERRDTRRVTIVEDFRANTQRSHARHDNRHVAAWWEPRSDQYGFQRWRSGLQPVTLCEHGDKFYVLGDRYGDDHDRGWRRDRN